MNKEQTIKDIKTLIECNEELIELIKNGVIEENEDSKLTITDLEESNRFNLMRIALLKKELD